MIQELKVIPGNLEKFFYDSSKSDENTVHRHYKSFSTGRRKKAVAKVNLSIGNGSISINSKTLIEYFPRISDRQQVLYPLNIICGLGKLDVSAQVSGGGTTGNYVLLIYYYKHLVLL